MSGLRVVVLPCLVALLSPGPVHAEEAGIDVPMRRDGAATREQALDAVPEGLLAATALVRGEVETLRQEFGAYDYPGRAEPHRDRRPIHVHVKALEVMSKVAALQRRFGVPDGAVRDMPVSDVSPEEAMGAVQDVLDGIGAIKTQMVIATVPDLAASAGMRGLSDAYTNLADASVLLDGLVGREFTLRDVLLQIVPVIDDIGLIATRLQVSLDTEAPDPGVSAGRQLVDVAQQAMRAAYKAVALQTQLGMQASAVPTLTMVRVSATEVHDLIGILRAELARIKGHLGISVLSNEVEAASGAAGTEDLFGQVLLVVRGLDQLAAGAGAPP